MAIKTMSVFPHVPCRVYLTRVLKLLAPFRINGSFQPLPVYHTFMASVPPQSLFSYFFSTKKFLISLFFEALNYILFHGVIKKQQLTFDSVTMSNER